MKKIIIAIAIILAVFAYFQNKQSTLINEKQTSVSTNSSDSSDAVLARAFSNHESGLQVSGQGKVIRLLSDDNDGSRHQRFIVQLDSGQTLLIVHNIDIAPRVESIGKGDLIQFNGEYEWNAEGGLIHWTHIDPKGSHAPGWLKRRIYQ